MRAVAVMAFALPIRADRRRKNAPKAVSVRPTATAASRNSDAARLLLRRVAEDRIFPPEILLRGANESQEVKCLGLGHAERSVPHSPTSLSARYGPSPWICVKSIPSTAYRASRAAKLGALDCLVLCRGAGSGFAGVGRVAFNCFRTVSIRLSHSATFF